MRHESRRWLYYEVLLLCALFLILVLCAFSLIFLILDIVPKHFGKHSGAMLILSIVMLVIFCGISGKLVVIGRRRVGIALFLFGLSAFFGFFSWFLHPAQVYARADERLYDILTYIDNCKTGPDRESRDYYGRAVTELHARRQEANAMRIRSVGDPEYFQDPFVSYICAIISAILAIYAVTAIIDKRWIKDISELNK
ncbi:MAG: hypothetical protein GXY15_01080 [Candidatus Hydrogenedentes bacterium]|nr:hypothetical protein [Candidatus Hydrogenedentota bacterium]